MAQTLGTVTKNKTGGFEGNLHTMTIKTRIKISPIKDKKSKKHPDFIVFAEGGVKIGSGWNNLAKENGNPFVSLSLEFIELGPRVIYVNLAPVETDEKEEIFNLLWNAEA